MACALHGRFYKEISNVKQFAFALTFRTFFHKAFPTIERRRRRNSSASNKPPNNNANLNQICYPFQLDFDGFPWISSLQQQTSLIRWTLHRNRPISCIQMHHPNQNCYPEIILLSQFHAKINIVFITIHSSSDNGCAYIITHEPS